MPAGLSYELRKTINSLDELRQLIQLLQRILDDINSRLTILEGP